MVNENDYCITFENVQQAAARIQDVVVRTPVLTSQTIIPGTGKSYFFKVEAMQRTGSFKFRGAINAVKVELESSASTGSTMPVVTHSSGNHGQGLALAAKLASTDACSVSATIVMPETAPLVKKRAVACYGATIVEVANTIEAREEAAERIVRTTGAVIIHSSQDPRVIAGQGTVCTELVEQVREMAGIELDAVIIPVGGGGLASGSAIALRGLLGENVKIILAEPSALDDAKRSFTEGKLLKHNPDNKLDSVADGLKTTLGPNTWPIVRDFVDDIFTVTEEEILRATKLVWERLKVCIEPSAGVGVAVAMGTEFNDKYTVESGVRNVGILLCGGNVDIISTAAQMNNLGL